MPPPAGSPAGPSRASGFRRLVRSSAPLPGGGRATRERAGVDLRGRHHRRWSTGRHDRLSRGRVVVRVAATGRPPSGSGSQATRARGSPILSEVGIDGARVSSHSTAAARRCVTMGTIDDDPVRARVVGGVDGEGQRLVAGCDAAATSGRESTDCAATPAGRSTRWCCATVRARTAHPASAGAGRHRRPEVVLVLPGRSRASADSPYLLVVGQNVNPGWRATMDGATAGATRRRGRLRHGLVGARPRPSRLRGRVRPSRTL